VASFVVNTYLGARSTNLGAVFWVLAELCNMHVLDFITNALAEDQGSMLKTQFSAFFGEKIGLFFLKKPMLRF
jgi:hypothetical protein